MINLATLWEAGKFAASSYTWARKQLGKKSDYAMDRVNNLVNQKRSLVRIHRIVRRTPTVTITRLAQLTPEIAALAAIHGSTLELNERQALAVDWTGSDVNTIRAETCYFADVLALRDQAKSGKAQLPAVISAGALVICPKERSLVLHLRSATSVPYPNALHILGGAFKPPRQFKDIDEPGDRMSLEFTMLREVFEESGLIVRRYDEPVCVAEELDTGFIQYVYLGVRITAAQFSQLAQNPEGDLVKMSYDDLKMRLSDPEGWVPTGRAQVLMWLGLGAPGAGWNARFAGLNAKELFNALTS